MEVTICPHCQTRDVIMYDIFEDKPFMWCHHCLKIIPEPEEEEDEDESSRYQDEKASKLN